MKRYLKYTFLLISFFAFKNQSVAQGPPPHGSIQDFEVLPTYLQTGKIKINSGSQTIIKFKVKFSRVVHETYPELIFKPFNMTVMLLTNNNQNIIQVGKSHSFTSAIFTGNDVFSWVEITDTITNSLLVPGSNIGLAYKSPDMPSNGYGSPPTQSYAYTTAPPPIITYTNVAKSGYFTKNNCASGQYLIGSTVTYTVAAGTYSSTDSQAAANALAQADVAANGQTYANNNGTCTVANPTDYIRIGGDNFLYKSAQISTWTIEYTGIYANYPRNTGWLQMPPGWNVTLVKPNSIHIGPSSNAVSGLVRADIYVNGQSYEISKYVEVRTGSLVEP